jgi:hypothetical protein
MDITQLQEEATRRKRDLDAAKIALTQNTISYEDAKQAALRFRAAFLRYHKARWPDKRLPPVSVAGLLR